MWCSGGVVIVSEHQLTDQLQLKGTGRDLGFEMRM